MAVPKKRTGHSAQGHRRSNWKATKPETTTCPKCGATQLTHTVCTECGYYKGRAVSIKSPDYVETPLKKATKPAKKTSAKKSTKKAEVAVEPSTEVAVAESTEVVQTESAEVVEVEEKKVEEKSDEG